MEFESIPVLTGVQTDHKKSTLANFDNRYEGNFYNELKVLADTIMKDKLEHTFVFLTGTPGNGKTHFLVGLFRSKVCTDEGVMGAEHALYLPYATMISEIIAGFSDTPSTRSSLAKFLPIKYLFIDDISRGERTIDPERIEGQVFRDILLDRYENKKHLICTSNYSKIELLRMIKNVFGDYVASRVSSASIFYEFPKGDFRKGHPDAGTTKV